MKTQIIKGKLKMKCKKLLCAIFSILITYKGYAVAGKIEIPKTNLLTK